MPAPGPATPASTPPPSRGRAATRTWRPGGLERLALSSRVSSTWRSRPGAAWGGGGPAGRGGGPRAAAAARLREHGPAVGVDGADGELAAAHPGQVQEVLDQAGQPEGL